MTVSLAGAPPGEDKAVLNVEVCLRPDSAVELGAVRAAALQFLSSLSSVRYAEGPLHPPPGQHPLLDAHVQSIRVVDLAPGRIPPGRLLLQWDVAWQVRIAAGRGRGGAVAYGHPPALLRADAAAGGVQGTCSVHPHNHPPLCCARCACLRLTARAQQTTTRGRTAPPLTESGCCPRPSSTAAGRRWWVLGRAGGVPGQQLSLVA